MIIGFFLFFYLLRFFSILSLKRSRKSPSLRRTNRGVFTGEILLLLHCVRDNNSINPRVLLGTQYYSLRPCPCRADTLVFFFFNIKIYYDSTDTVRKKRIKKTK